jgi:hypothetical protein
MRMLRGLLDSLPQTGRLVWIGLYPAHSVETGADTQASFELGTTATMIC